MEVARSKYINPYTDFGFKKLFGEEANKDLLIDFLNELLPPHHQIKEMSFRSGEHQGRTAEERRAVFDIYCESATGTKFIVEMQKDRMTHIKDRALYYSTFPIREQAEKGEWNFELAPIYCVALLNFEFLEDSDEINEEAGKKKRRKSRPQDPQGEDYQHVVQLKDDKNRVFYKKLMYIFIEMPRFTKELHDLKTHFEKWLYFLKHLEDFDEIPEILKEKVFAKAFEVAEIARFNRQQLDEYEESLKSLREMFSVAETHYNEGLEEGLEKGERKGLKKGREEGRLEGKLENAKNFLENGVSLEIVLKSIGLTEEQLQAAGILPEE